MGNGSAKGQKLGSSASKGQTLGRSLSNQPIVNTYEVAFTEKTLGLKILQNTDNKPQVKDIVEGSMAESCGKIVIGDIIIKVNDITIDAYENFMFIIPTTERPVSLTFMRTTHATGVSRLIPAQKSKQTSSARSYSSSSAATAVPTASIREKDLPGNYLTRDPTPTLGNTTFENEQQKEKRRLAALAAVEKRENLSNKYKGNSKFAVRSNNKTERQLFKERAEKQAKLDAAALNSKEINVGVADNTSNATDAELQRRIAATKKSEQDLINSLGYNPYKPSLNSNSSQVRGAITTAAHGTMNLVGASNGEMESGSFVAPGAVSTPSISSSSSSSSSTSSSSSIKREGSADSNTDVDLSSTEWISASQVQTYIDETTASVIDESIGVVFSSQDDTVEMSDSTLFTIYKMMTNLALNPTEAKFARIRIQNNAFQKKVGKINGAIDVFVAAGFVFSDEPANAGAELEPFLVFDTASEESGFRLRYAMQMLRDVLYGVPEDNITAEEEEELERERIETEMIKAAEAVSMDC